MLKRNGHVLLQLCSFLVPMGFRRIPIVEISRRHARQHPQPIIALKMHSSLEPVQVSWPKTIFRAHMFVCMFYRLQHVLCFSTRTHTHTHVTVDTRTRTSSTKPKKKLHSGSRGFPRPQNANWIHVNQQTPFPHGNPNCSESAIGHDPPLRLAARTAESR